MIALNYSTLIDPLMKDVRQLIPLFGGMKAGDNVLDICCGTGDQVYYYAQQNIKAIGIDIDKRMVELFKNDNRRFTTSYASYIKTDALELPFKDNSFDFVSICLGLHEKTRNSRNLIIYEMRRVVKKKGSIIIVDYHVPLPHSLLGYLARLIEFFAGGAHYQGFKDYVDLGGLNDIISGHQLVEEKRHCFKNGLIEIVKVITI